jgi:GT2 family glycosyltransferase
MNRSALVKAVLRGVADSPDRLRYILHPRRIAKALRILLVDRDELPAYAEKVRFYLSLPTRRYRTKPPKGDPRAILSGLSFPGASSPEVSVIVPVHGQLLHTAHCLRSLRERWPAVPCEVVVADDLSPDGTAEALSAVPGLRLLRNGENLGFLRTCNRAAREARGTKAILFLNNDTEVTEGWLDELVAVLERRPDAGIVGSRLAYPDGTLQEAGAIVWNDGTGWNYGRGADPDRPEYNRLRECDYVSGASLLVRRSLFDSLGGFDERYAPAYYEDTDLCFRARAAGWKVMVQPKSTVIHFEGVSHGRSVKSGVKRYQEENRGKFVERWREVLLRHHAPPGADFFHARDRSAGKRSILVVDHYVPTPDRDAGSRSTFQYLKLFADSGINVAFLGDNFFRAEPYTTNLENLGIEVLGGEWFRKNWKRWVAENGGSYDTVYLHRPNIAVKHLPLFEALSPRPRIVFFGHDLHSLRLSRQHAVEGGGGLPAEAESWRRLEFSLFGRVDQVLYPSDAEVEEIAAATEGKVRAKVLPLNVYDPPSRERRDAAATSGLLFVGGFGHAPNVDAVKWLVAEVMPLLRERLPGAALTIVGSNAPPDVLALASPGVEVRGFVDDGTLDSLYARCRVAVVPLRYGAGVKGKVIEALHRGTPLVTTPVGAEGIPGIGTAASVADGASAFAGAVASAYRDEAALEAMSERGRLLVESLYGREAVWKTVEPLFFPPRRGK